MDPARMTDLDAGYQVLNNWQMNTPASTQVSCIHRFMELIAATEISIQNTTQRHVQARLRNQVTSARALLDKVFKVATKPDNMLQACFQGRLEVAQGLKAAGVSVQIMDTAGHSSLHFAVSSGDLSLVKWLVERQVPVTCTGLDGSSALHWACSQRKTSIVFFLVHNKALINQRNLKGFTPLHLVCCETDKFPDRKISARIALGLAMAGGDTNLPCDLDKTDARAQLPRAVMERAWLWHENLAWPGNWSRVFTTRDVRRTIWSHLTLSQLMAMRGTCKKMAALVFEDVILPKIDAFYATRNASK